MSVAAPVPAADDVPVVDSFAVAAQLRMTAAGTTGRLTVALPEDVKVTPGVLVPALLTLGQRILEDHRLTGPELPQVEVTAVDQAQTVPVTAPAIGFTLGVTNELSARRSNIVLDSDRLLANDDGLLLIAATLLAGAEHLLETRDVVIRT